MNEIIQVLPKAKGFTAALVVDSADKESNYHVLSRISHSRM